MHQLEFLGVGHQELHLHAADGFLQVRVVETAHARNLALARDHVVVHDEADGDAARDRVAEGLGDAVVEEMLHRAVDLAAGLHAIDVFDEDRGVRARRVGREERSDVLLRDGVLDPGGAGREERALRGEARIERLPVDVRVVDHLIGAGALRVDGLAEGLDDAVVHLHDVAGAGRREERPVVEVRADAVGREVAAREIDGDGALVAAVDDEELVVVEAPDVRRVAQLAEEVDLDVVAAGALALRRELRGELRAVALVEEALDGEACFSLVAELVEDALVREAEVRDHDLRLRRVDGAVDDGIDARFHAGGLRERGDVGVITPRGRVTVVVALRDGVHQVERGVLVLLLGAGRGAVGRRRRRRAGDEREGERRGRREQREGVAFHG